MSAGPSDSPSSAAPADLSADDSYKLVTQNLQEVVGAEELRARLSEGNEKPLKLYWGTATTGRPHVAYFVPITKIAEFLHAGCKVVILLADLHAYLDNMKAPWELLELRTKYYEVVIRGMLTSVGVDISKLEFVKGSTFQLTEKYTRDVYRLMSMTSEHDARKAGCEVVKQVASPMMASLLYPGLQALDEEYLDVDCQFGGVDQRKIFMYAREYLPRLGYRKRIHLMNPMVPGLQGTKMSSSEPASKIDLLDSAKAVEKKIKSAFCEERNIESNAVLSFVKMVLMPIAALRKENTFVVERKEEFGGNVTFSDYPSIESAFAAGDLHPGDLKKAVTREINRLLNPIRALFEEAENKALAATAYPDAPTDKKGKNKGGAGPATADLRAPDDFSRVDVRVGRIISAEPHPEADSLYLEKIDCGDDTGPRTVISGLVKFIPLEQMQDRMVVVVCNLKPAKMRGIVSEAMVLAASNDDHTAVELLVPPAGATVGERIVCSLTGDAAPEAILNPKKKTFETVAAHLTTSDTLEATYKGTPITTASGGTCTVASLKSAHIR